MSMDRSDFNLVYALVRQIPVGKVATYGQIARWLGWPYGARTVGWALRELKEGTDVPWYRVVNAQGKTSLGAEGAQEQYALLAAEGVVVDAQGRVDLKAFGWAGPGQAAWDVVAGMQSPAPAEGRGIALDSMPGVIIGES